MIAVLTYDRPHRKSQDLLCRLKVHGYDDVKVLAFPWIDRKNHKPMISHRPGEPRWPAQPWPLQPEEMCRNLGYSYGVCSSEDMPLYLQHAEMALIGGAGILTRQIVESTLVLNAHPALLPFCRGLDALKWAVYKALPAGVTLHVVDESCDAGFLIKQELVPLYQSDTFHAFAHRQYEMEMDLLVDGIRLVREMEEGWQAQSALPKDTEQYIVGRRMRHIDEMVMLRRFEHRRDLGGPDAAK
jgi:phosphoribosylglycinamide formyltransferase-1